MEKTGRLHLYAAKVIRDGPARHRLWLKYVVSHIPIDFKDHPILGFALIIGGIIGLAAGIMVCMMRMQYRPPQKDKND
jgi:hypothetical protein